jgi:hypothetical protein
MCNLFAPGIFPSFEEGSLRPPSKCHGTLNRAQQGRSYVFSQQAFDLPCRAEIKVTRHLLDRRGHPSSKEGENAKTPIRAAHIARR